MYSRINHVQNPARELAQDNEMVMQVVTRLRTRLGTSVRGFRVTAHTDGLILQGSVTSRIARHVIQSMVMEATGRSVIANEIQVQFGAVARDGFGDRG